MKLGIVTGGTILPGEKVGDEKALTNVLPYDKARAEFRAIKARGGDGFDIVRVLTVEKVAKFKKVAQSVSPDATPLTPEQIAAGPTPPATTQPETAPPTAPSPEPTKQGAAAETKPEAKAKRR